MGPFCRQNSPSLLPSGVEMQGAPAYQHSSQPQAVNRTKFREPLAQAVPASMGSNIMFDRRVVRGNTYAAQILPATAQAEQMELERTMAKQKQKLQDQRARMQTKPPEEVPPVEDRKHIDVQTEAYLEELTDRVIEHDIDTQTDAFMDQPPAPVFIPMKTGLDQETQIYDGDLFDFDVEVDPILEVLVGKTLEQSMMEVMEEEELANMRTHQEHFAQIRNAELAETQRMEEQEKRRFEEKERRLAQEQARLQRERQVTEKVAARTFTKGYLSDLHAAVFANLSDAGFFYNPLEREVQNSFMPWLYDGMEAQLDNIRNARALATEMLNGAAEHHVQLQKESKLLRESIEEEKRRLEEERLKAKEEEAGDEKEGGY